MNVRHNHSTRQRAKKRGGYSNVGADDGNAAVENIVTLRDLLDMINIPLVQSVQVTYTTIRLKRTLITLIIYNHATS